MRREEKLDKIGITSEQYEQFKQIHSCACKIMDKGRNVFEDYTQYRAYYDYRSKYSSQYDNYWPCVSKVGFLLYGTPLHDEFMKETSWSCIVISKYLGKYIDSNYDITHLMPTE